MRNHTASVTGTSTKDGVGYGDAPHEIMNIFWIRHLDRKQFDHFITSPPPNRCSIVEGFYFLPFPLNEPY